MKPDWRNAWPGLGALLVIGLLLFLASAARAQTFIPPMTEAELMLALNPAFSDPRIPAIRARAEAGDVPGALTDYLVYRRSLPYRHPLRNPARELSDNALMTRSARISNDLIEQNLLWPFFLGWTSATVYREPFDWARLKSEFLRTWRDAVRGYFWNDLARMRLATGEDRYFNTWWDSISRFILDVRPQPPRWPPGTAIPYPPDFRFYPYNTRDWTPINVGIRMQDTLVGSLAYLLDDPLMTPEIHARVVIGIVEHARANFPYDTFHFNFQTIEAAGLMSVAALYPEFAESDAWYAEAVRKALNTVRTHYFDDGAQYEQSLHYHMVVARNLWLICELHRFARPHEPPLDEVEARLEQAIHYSLMLQRPDGTEPMVGDGVGNLPMREGFYADEWRDSGGLHYGLARFGRSDWRFFANEPEATPPKADWFFRPSGVAVFRSGWDPGHLWALVHLGPFGRNHPQEDGLNVLYEESGHHWLVDPGRGMEVPLHQQYFLNSSGHNTARPLARSQARFRLLTVPEAIDPARALSPLVVEDQPVWAFARGIYADGYQPWGVPNPGDGLPDILKEARHTRHVMIERDSRRLWIADWVENPDPVSWEFFFQLDTLEVTEMALEGSAIPPAEGASRRAFRARRPGTPPNAEPRTLFLHALAPETEAEISYIQQGQVTPELSGWMQDAWAAPRPITTLRSVGAPSVASWRLWVFEPAEGWPDSLATPAAELLPIVAQEPAPMGLAPLATRLIDEARNVEILVIFNPARVGLTLTAMGVATDAEWAALWWRRAQPGMPRRLLRFGMVEGTYLHIGADTLHQSPIRQTLTGAPASMLVMH